MAWRLAKSLETLRAQINSKWPKRSKVSDGTIGDQAHSSRASDHNPNPAGVVTAFDITEDFKNGPNLPKLLPLLLKDRRTKYIIYEAKIYNPTIQGGAARPYSGVNAHKQHLHISVSAAKEHYDSVSPWQLDSANVETPPVTETKRTTLKRGMTGGDVPVLQLRLRELGYYSGLVDGDFGPQTEKSLKTAQKALGLKVDGVCGPLTWKALSAATKPPTASEQTENVPFPSIDWPKHTLEYFEAGGLPKPSAAAFTAGFMWESGGNSKKPPTIIWDAVGDAGKSHGAGQWNGPRWLALQDFAFQRGKPYSDPDTQLAFALYELRTSEKRAHAALMAANTIEEANSAAITYWRPSIPHADRRLAIAKKLHG